MRTRNLIYDLMTPLYDVVCGALLQPGRRRAMSLLEPRAGERILEVGVGTGFGVNHYPATCRVVAIDLSRKMVARAVRRVDRTHRSTIAFAQMDAGRLAFPSGVFDAVFVPHTINVVDDAVAVGRELVRVCSPNGRIVFLNHFDGIPETSNAINRAVGFLASAVEVNWKLRLEPFLRALDLRATAIESVNVPRLSSIVVCTTSADGSSAFLQTTSDSLNTPA